MVTTTKLLYMVWSLDNDKTLTVTLAQPKDNLGYEDVEPVMQSAIDDNVFLVGTARATAIKDAYIKTVTKDVLEAA